MAEDASPAKREALGNSTGYGELKRIRMQMAGMTAAEHSSVFGIMLAAVRSDWLETTGEEYPVSLWEIQRQAVLAGIDIDNFLDGGCEFLAKTPWTTLAPLIHVSLQNRWERLKPKTALGTIRGGDESIDDLTPVMDVQVEEPLVTDVTNQKKHSLRDDDNTLCLAEARDTGSTFPSAAAFVRDYLEKQPKCKSTQKAFEQTASPGIASAGRVRRAAGQAGGFRTMKLRKSSKDKNIKNGHSPALITSNFCPARSKTKKKAQK